MEELCAACMQLAGHDASHTTPAEGQPAAVRFSHARDLILELADVLFDDPETLRRLRLTNRTWAYILQPVLWRNTHFRGYFRRGHRVDAPETRSQKPVMLPSDFVDRFGNPKDITPLCPDSVPDRSALVHVRTLRITTSLLWFMNCNELACLANMVGCMPGVKRFVWEGAKTPYIQPALPLSFMFKHCKELEAIEVEFTDKDCSRDDRERPRRERYFDARFARAVHKQPLPKLRVLSLESIVAPFGNVRGIWEAMSSMLSSSPNLEELTVTWMRYFPKGMSAFAFGEYFVEAYVLEIQMREFWERCSWFHKARGGRPLPVRKLRLGQYPLFNRSFSIKSPPSTYLWDLFQPEALEDIDLGAMRYEVDGYRELFAPSTILEPRLTNLRRVTFSKYDDSVKEFIETSIDNEILSRWTVTINHANGGRRAAPILGLAVSVVRKDLLTTETKQPRRGPRVLILNSGMWDERIICPRRFLDGCNERGKWYQFSTGTEALSITLPPVDARTRFAIPYLGDDMQGEAENNFIQRISNYFMRLPGIKELNMVTTSDYVLVDWLLPYVDSIISQNPDLERLKIGSQAWTIRRGLASTASDLEELTISGDDPVEAFVPRRDYDHKRVPVAPEDLERVFETFEKNREPWEMQFIRRPVEVSGDARVALSNAVG
jgi:hypothetical protein